MNGLNLLLEVLAVWQIVEVYHHGTIFQGVRAYLEASGGLGDQPWAFLSELQSCPFCLSVWAAALVLLMDYAFLHPLVVILAISRAANLANDLTHRFCRTPNRAEQED